jgi:hypothetical protein
VTQITKLAAVFRNSFNFDTQIAELNVASKPQHQLDRHIAASIEANEGPRALLIVVYQGYSAFNSLYGRLELSASSNPALSPGISQSAVVNWRRAEHMLCSDGVDGDVLMLLDVSYPTDFFESLRASTQIKSTKRLCELISACPSPWSELFHWCAYRNPVGPGAHIQVSFILDSADQPATTYGSEQKRRSVATLVLVQQGTSYRASALEKQGN